MIGEVEKAESLITDWETVPVESIALGIDRQMVENLFAAIGQIGSSATPAPA